ncbi:hypothetical protein C8F00_2562 [Xanthomonas vasicola]
MRRAAVSPRRAGIVAVHRHLASVGDARSLGLCMLRGVETLSTAEIVEQIAELRRAHRALDEEIQRVPANMDDELQMKRLKKRKLHIKDCITRLEMELVPDEPA